MSRTGDFYREQAAASQREAEGASLPHVRERSERAAAAWTAMADRHERTDDARLARIAASGSAGAGVAAALAAGDDLAD